MLHASTQGYAHAQKRPERALPAHLWLILSLYKSRSEGKDRVVNCWSVQCAPEHAHRAPHQRVRNPMLQVI